MLNNREVSMGHTSPLFICFVPFASAGLSRIPRQKRIPTP
jgi:hypothetical protein